mmetsp:Transcript_12824/g.22110  ORF Transcript_12824/g.22110 Transcript_12824/m.22110 type:complete len:215 (-) Transcript_12824:141-785(-)
MLSWCTDSHTNVRLDGAPLALVLHLTPVLPVRCALFPTFACWRAHIALHQLPSTHLRRPLCIGRGLPSLPSAALWAAPARPACPLPIFSLLLPNAIHFPSPSPAIHYAPCRSAQPSCPRHLCLDPGVLLLPCAEQTDHVRWWCDNVPSHTSRFPRCPVCLVCCKHCPLSSPHRNFLLPCAAALVHTWCPTTRAACLWLSFVVAARQASLQACVC